MAAPVGVARLAGQVGLALGIAVLVGWSIDSAFLRSVAPGLATINANTACCFILLGLALLCHVARRPTRATTIAGVVALVLSFGIAAASFTQFLLGVDLAGRMAPLMGLVFMALAASLAMSYAGRWPIVAQGLGMLSLTLLFLGGVAILYGAESLQRRPLFAPIAVHATLAAMGIAAGVVAATRPVGLIGLLIDPGTGGMVARRLLPASIGAPILLGWGRLELQRSGTIDLELGLALFATMTVVIFSGLVIWAGMTIGRSASREQQAHAEVLSLNRALEARVTERTNDLKLTEQRFRAIFHSQFEFIGLMTPDGTLIEANRTALEAAGVCEHDVLNRPFWETAWWRHDPVQQQRLIDACVEAARGKHVRFEASHPMADGNLIWVDFSLTPFRDESGQVILLIPEGRDITDRKRLQEDGLVREELLNGAFEHAPIGMALVSPTGKWLRVNRAVCQMLGYSADEMLATDSQAITHPDDLQADLDQVHRLLNSKIDSYQMEKRYRHKSGQLVEALLSVALVRDAQGQPLYFISHIKDITPRKNTERALAAHQNLLSQFIRYSPAAIAMFDRNLNYLQYSDRWLVDYKLQDHTIRGRCHYEIFPDVPERWKQIHQRVLAGAVERCDEDPFQRADGRTEWLQWECRPWRNAQGDIGGIIMFTQVITERKLAEQTIRRSLREKEVLLKEIHHRVKNNLQIVSALLDLQAGYTDDSWAVAMFQESRGRVRSMALIHERLYRSQDIARVDFDEYLTQLIDDLRRTYRRDDSDVRVEQFVNVPPFAIDLAIPCGLLLNELISNCFKHAFNDDRRGLIQVSLRSLDDDWQELCVADNGVGFPQGVDPTTINSFGLQLVSTLVEQLNGSLVLRNDSGATVLVRFPRSKHEPPERPIA